MLTDAFGRVASDLRISLTDRCNLRCQYCMPAEGMDWLPKAKLLTTDEIVRLARIFVGLGITELKLTGGEPTARAELVEIVERLREIDSDVDISLTTNGLRLAELAPALKAAGLDRVTVSCDSLLQHRYAELTRRDALDAVQRGISAAQDAGLLPIKINCVVMRGTNDDEAVAFAELARGTGHHVRFIEYMPLDAEQRWDADRVVASSELRAAIERAYPLVATDEHGPASTFHFADDAPGSIGFISSVSEPFCDSCNRIRVTADGQFRSCLFALDETDLRSLLRSDATDDAIADVIRDAVARKWSGHRIGQNDFVRPARSMSQIGG